MKKTIKLLLLTMVFDFLFVVVATLIMFKNETINLINNFEIQILLLFLAILFLPAVIPALLVSKIKKDSKKIFIIKQSILVIIILLFYFLMVKYVLS